MFELFYQYVIYACCLIILECRYSFSVFFLGEWINKSCSLCSNVVRIGRFGLVGMFPLPLTISWCATWLALTKHGGVGVVGLLDMLLIVFFLCFPVVMNYELK